MKKTLSLALSFLFLLIASGAYAQSKYGNVTMDEMNMTSYPKDTTAAAVILLKNGETSFKYSDLYGFQFEHTIQVKIKILKNEGLQWCNQGIPYFQISNTAKEVIDGLSGTTYNLEDGKIVKQNYRKNLYLKKSRIPKEN